MTNTSIKLSTRKKIMIVDDEADILEAVQIMLEDAGYEVSTAMNRRTVRDVEKELPDLLLLDIGMPGIDGTTICRKLKNQDETKHTPIIMCSANKDAEKLSRECGADDFITKPFEMDMLLAKVKKYTK